ncbi:GntR family transcriptional regulator [Verticiella sediminum]|nr:GntR family transcriptional regulator [Verticiella sediminum]
MTGVKEAMPLEGEATTTEATQPRFAQVRDAVRADILAGVLPAGGRLPSEAQLCRQYGVSRITVRQALAELQASGLVHTVNGRGSFVSQPRAPGGQGPLVGVLEAMRKRGWKAHGRLLSHSVQKADAEVALALNLPPRTPVGAVTVARYCDDVPFAVGTTYLAPELAERLAAQDLEHNDVTDVLHRLLGLRTARTRVTVQAVAAQGMVARRLRKPAGAPLLRVLTTGLDYEGQPATYSETYGTPELLEYRVTLHNDTSSAREG